jgi:hypothetical protein
MIKLLFLAAAFAAVGSLPVAAQAAEHTNASGHYEWRSVQQVGPRAPATAQHRVWVADGRQVADCDCDMMKMTAADCMMPMKNMGEKSHG